MQQVHIEASFDAWRSAARACLAAAHAPATLHFVSDAEAQVSLWTPRPAAPPPAAAPRVPAPFVRLAQSVAQHRDPGRWDLLYRLLWRLTHGEPRLLEVAVDPDVAQMQRLEHAVGRDVHKMHAFVRFAEVRDEAATPGGDGDGGKDGGKDDGAADGDGRRWVAWYRPDHFVLRRAVPHFVKRYPSMRWSLLCDYEAAHYDGHSLSFGPGCPRRDAPGADALEGLWQVYYRSIFNPARLKVRAMRQEMPQRFWHTMPETRLIDGLVKEAPMRTQKLIDDAPASATPYLPADRSSHAALVAAAGACAACPWAKQSTQTVFGEGPLDAAVAMVGEQPGDLEDRAGRPFVGPAGALFDRALAAAGIDRAGLYVTNAVKHFKYEPRGTRRIHQKPLARDLSTCRPWLAAELQLVRPRVLVCLGLSAAQSVLGRAVRLRDVRAVVQQTPWCSQTMVTTHPSAVLRAPDADAQAAAFAAFVDDLRAVHALQTAATAAN